jgi:hypothetical protein
MLVSNMFIPINFNTEPVVSSYNPRPYNLCLDAPVLTINKNFSTDGRFRLSWTAVEGAGLYEIWQDPCATCIKFVDQETTLLYWNFKYERDGNYTFYIIALNETCYSDHSNSVTITIDITYEATEPLNILPYLLGFVGAGMIILIVYGTYKKTKQDLIEEKITREK